MKTSGQQQVCVSQAAVGSCKAPAPSVISATSLVSTPNPISGKATVSGQLYHHFISLSLLWPRIFLEAPQFSSFVSDSLRPHESQHARPPCPSPTPGVHSDSDPSSWWCHPAIASVVPFSSCPQSLPASGSFPVSQLFTWGGQSIGVSASASVFPMNTQDWSPLGWTGWISLQSKGLSPKFCIINY